MTISDCSDIEILGCPKLAAAIDAIAAGKSHEISGLDKEIAEIEADVADAKRLIVKIKSGTMTRKEAIALTGLTEDELADCVDVPEATLATPPKEPDTKRSVS